MLDTTQHQALAPDECLRDLTFELSATSNAYLVEQKAFRDRYIIGCSLLMDIMILSFMYFFYAKGKSYRIVLAYAFYFGCRTFLQVSFEC